jgi:CubicO group peptidase (beta-lactamase class C family)
MSCLGVKICRKCSLLAAFLLFFQSAFSQNNFNKVDQWLQTHLDQLGGRATLVIFKGGKIIYNISENQLSPRKKMILRFIAKRNGDDVNEALKDFNLTTREPVASCSKWLSAALVMTFVDEGKLNLNDTIGKFFPGFSKYQKGNITIRDCLAHLTAIKSGSLKDSRKLLSESNSMDEAMNKIALLPMEGKPGAVFRYSSIALQIAVAVVEKISGKDFRTLFNERISLPCGMKNTDWGNKKIPIAAGDANSTPEDYLHFLQMILQNGTINGNQVLSENSIIAMQQDYTKNARVAYSPTEGKGFDYGLGEWILEPGNPRAASITSPGLFGSFPWVDNKRQYAAFLFVVNINNKGRMENYTLLKSLVDQAIDNGNF